MAWTRNSPLALLALAGFWGCGVYSFRGSLPAHIDSIAVSNVINQTSEFVLTDLTNELITDLFLTENVLRVTDLSNADSDLQVTINRITDTPSTFTAGESVQEWQINVSTKVIWYKGLPNATGCTRWCGMRHTRRWKVPSYERKRSKGGNGRGRLR